MMKYELQLIEEKVKQHQVTGLHLICALTFLGSGAIIFVYNFTIKPWGLALFSSGLLLLSITLIKNKFMTKEGNNLVFRLLELIIALGWAVYSAMMEWKLPMGIFGTLSAALIFSLYWERKGNSVQYIYIDDTGIRLPFDSRKRFIDWKEAEQVLFRFGTLSIDCIDNRLFQWNVHDTVFSPAELEAFCAQLIEANRDKRRKNDW